MIGTRLFIRNAGNFVTSPIFYANAEPHIGHAYTAVLCDTAHRWNKLRDPKNAAIFSIGTDEHGSKIFQASQVAQKSPKEFCDGVSGKFENLFKKMNINFTHWIRTTSPEHSRAVQHFWLRLQENGFIYKSTYSGFYSVSDECFVTENEVETKNGKLVLKSTSTVVEWIEEENYMFRLSNFRKQIGEWIENSEVVQPMKYKKLALDSLEMEEDLSISRARSRLSWGIEVPNDPTQTIYVWLDALVNYLTVSGYPNQQTIWPPTCQIIGKDITKFHIFYWPAFLMAANLPLPQKVFIHGHWLVDNVKMSKSLGNVINPIEAMDKYSVEGLRYFLLKQGNPSSDCSFSASSCLETINSDMVNNVGNLLNRSTVERINKNGKYPKMDGKMDEKLEKDAEKLMEMLRECAEKCSLLYEEMMYYKIIEYLMSIMKESNRLFQISEPWKEKNEERLENLLFSTYESIRIVSILIQPITPQMAQFSMDRLGIPKNERNLENAHFGSYSGGKLGSDNGIFIERIQK